MSKLTWGVVSTIKAPAKDILAFAAHHLDLGAHRVFIYLDDDAPAARAALKAHPKCRVILCDDGYWARRFKHKGRPDKHQQRQSANATHCYGRGPQVDWLLHIDVDEFVISDNGLSDDLNALSDEVFSARIRPIEALAPTREVEPGVIWCKALSREVKTRARQTRAIYPRFGAQLNGGFLSHVAGKVAVRCGHEGVGLRIHNAFRHGEMDPAPAELGATRLAHLHAPSWAQFLDAYRFRYARGSYRSELRAGSEDGVNMHALFAALEAEGGEEALRDFYMEVCTATPELCARLEAHGLLHRVTLNLETKIARHFPDFVDE